MNRYMRVRYLVSFILVFQLNSAFADQWLYINPLKPDEFLSIETDPDLIGMFDVRENAKYCEPSSEYICIESTEFQFHIPRNTLEHDKSWNIKDVKYQVAFKKDIMLFGIMDTIYYIDQFGLDHKITFLYSTSRGLVGVGGVSENGSAIFLLDVKCGYGAQSNCAE